MPEKTPNDDLVAYLRDHYAGGVGALELIEHLSSVHQDDSLGAFFQHLQTDVKSDHDQLRNLMEAIGSSESSVRNAGAWVAEKAGRVKLGFSSGADARLRLLQSLEALYIGITGKRLLWRALEAVRESSEVLQQTDLAHLENRAREQAERVEEKRLEAARAALDFA